MNRFISGGRLRSVLVAVALATVGLAASAQRGGDGGVIRRKIHGDAQRAVGIACLADVGLAAVQSGLQPGAYPFGFFHGLVDAPRVHAVPGG